MTTQKVANRYVKLEKQGKYRDIKAELYAMIFGPICSVGLVHMAGSLISQQQ